MRAQARAAPGNVPACRVASITISLRDQSIDRHSPTSHCCHPLIDAKPPCRTPHPSPSTAAPSTRTG